MWWSYWVKKVKGQRNLKWVSALDWRPSKLEMWNVSSNINTYGTVWINLSPKWDYLKWQKSLELGKIFLWKLFNLLSISKIHKFTVNVTKITRDYRNQLVLPRTSRSGLSGRGNLYLSVVSAGQKRRWCKQLILFRLQHFRCNYWIMKSLWIVFAREYS